MFIQEVHKLVGKVTLPKYDGSTRNLARAWVQKLETYFHMNPMRETNTIRFNTLHLKGDAQDWWYHGLLTL